MERMQIKKRKDAVDSTVNTTNYDIYIDGEKQNMSWVRNIDIKLEAGENPKVTIEAHPRFLELDIDGEAETLTYQFLDEA